jgi:hypothetical protein
MLVCHPEQILPLHSPSKQRSDLSGCFGVFAGAGTTDKQLCFGMPGCRCNERRLQASQLRPPSRRRSGLEGADAGKTSGAETRKAQLCAPSVLADEATKAFATGIIDISPAARSAWLRRTVHRSPVYVAARDMDRPKRNSPPERPSHLTPYVSNSLAQAKRIRHQTAPSNPAYSNPQASGRSLP